jgi:hypothetical protein
MAFYDTTWYCNFGNGASTGYYAVPLRPQNTAVVAGQLCRQFTAPAVGSERVFVCTAAGTTANTTDATWSIARGNVTVDGTASWIECTGASAVNGDGVNTPTYSAARLISASPSRGGIIKRNNGASYQVCTSAIGVMGASEPAFSDTAGAATNDGTNTWTCIGPVGNFTGGQAPHARLASACAITWFSVGNTVYVGDNHAESQTTAITIGQSLLQTTMSRIICHNRSGSYPPTSSDLRTTATISTTAAVAINITFNSGPIYFYGLSFIAQVGQSSASLLSVGLTPVNAFYYFENCTFKTATTAAGALLQLNGVNAGTVLWNNCQVSFAAATQYIDIGDTGFTWQNTGQVLAAGSTVPNNLLNNSAANRLSNIMLEALDLSQVATVFATGAAAVTGNWVVKDCKLHASVTFPSPLNTGHVIQSVRADSAATAYKSARYAVEGTETTEIAITRVGGAVDPAGQAQSRKIVTTANSQWLRPFKAEPYAIWNATTGANVTVTVYGTINSASLPLNDELFMEVEYLASAHPGIIGTTTKATLLSAGVAVASDNSVWNGGGSGVGWSLFKLTATVTPGMAGVIEARIRAAKASTTYYIDPQIVLT